MTRPHPMKFCYELWVVGPLRLASSKFAPAPYGTHPRSGVLPVSVSRRRYRSTRPADHRRQGQPDPVGGIPSSGSPFRALLLPFPDPLQGLPELNGAGGSESEVPFQGTAELPELQGKGNRKDRPGHQDPLRVGHQCLPVPGVVILEAWAFLGDLGEQGRHPGGVIRVLKEAV